MKMRQFAAILLFLLFIPVLVNAKRLHVNLSGDDNQDGLSWSTARRSVQSAIDSADVGDEVWVANGIYTATHTRACDSAFLYASSFILKDGVSLYGGFKGDETTIEARPRDGDLLWQFSRATVLTVPSDAPGSVLFSDELEFEHSTFIDGFTLCGGTALGVGVEGIGGGAVLPGKAILQNCIIEGNLARDGGGVATSGNAIIRQCLIRDNDVVDEGWSGCGGGVFCEGNDAHIENCLVVANGQERTVRYGGGIHSIGNTCIAFCTVVDNLALRNGNAIVLERSGKLHSSIIWRNAGSNVQLSAPHAEIISCAIEGELHSGDNILLQRTNSGQNGILSNDNWVDGYYVCFANPDNGDFRLGPGSYAINRGLASIDGLPIMDVQGNARVLQELPDIGAFESPYKGNLAIDFEVAFPCYYKNCSKVTPKLGLCSPDSIVVAFTELTESSEWSENSGRWTATWNKAGSVRPQMDAVVTGEHAAAWDTAKLVRTLTISKRPIAVKARDIAYTYGEEFPMLEFEITAGSLAEGDTFTGNLACELGEVLDTTYPITCGSLAVKDGNNGNNYTIHFQEGLLSYNKAPTKISIVSAEAEYTGTPFEPQITTEPADLPITILYEGTGSTNYPASETPPTDTGTYHIIVVAENDLYAGTLEADITILPKLLTINADSKSRMYMEPNPEFTFTFEGFVPGDGVADIQLPSASTTAQPTSLPGSYPITLTGGSARNYTLLPKEGTLTVTKATLNATATTEAITYGDTLDDTLLHGNASLSFMEYDVPGTFSWVKPGQLLSKGTYTLEWLFTPEQTDRYLPVSDCVELSVNPMEVAVAADAKTIVYGQNDVPLTYTITAGHLIGNDAFTGTLTREAGTKAGSYLIQQGSLHLNDNYVISYSQATYIIQKATLANTDGDITATGLTYGQPLSDSEITGAIYNDNNGEVVPGEFIWEEPNAILSAGTHVVECRFIPDDTENFEAFSTTCEVTIAKAPFTITSPGASKTYGDEDPVIPYTVEEGMPQDVQVLGAPGRTEGEAAGNYELTAGTLALDNANYRVVFATDNLFTIHARSLEITATPASKHYGATDPELGYTIDNAIEGDDLLLSGKVARVAGEAVGDYDIELGTLATANANYAIRYTPALFTILRATLDMNDAELTATGITYGEPLSDSEISGIIYNDNNGEAVPGVFVWEEPDTVLPAGTHVVECRFVPEDEESYEAFTTTCEVIIAKAPFAISSPGASKTYGDEDPVIPYTVEAGMPQNVQVLGAPGRAAGEAAGNYELTSGTLALDNPNYRVVFATESLFTITRRNLEITALPSVKYFGADDPELGYTIDNAMEGDDLLLSGNVARVAGEAVGDYDIQLGTLVTANANYVIHYTPALFSIIRAELNLNENNLSATGITYGQPLSDSEITGTIYNDNNGEVVPGVFVWETPDLVLPAGTHVVECRFMPEDDESYEAFTTTCEVIIAKAPFAISSAGATKIYGDEDPVIPFTVEEGMPQEVQVLGAPGRAAGEAAGSYELTAGTLALDNPNYRVVFATDNLFTIHARSLEITATPAVKHYGATDPELGYTIDNAMEGDDLLLSGKLTRETGEAVGDYDILVGTLATANADYTINYTPALFSIIRAELNLNENNLSATGITYGQPLSDSEITGVIYNDNNGEVVLGVFVWEEPETVLPAGTHVVECRFVPEDEESYEEFTTTCEVTIAKAPFAISSPGATKTYGDEDPVIPFIVEEGMPQNVQVLGAPGRVAGEAAGSYELTVGTLALDNPNYRVAFATDSLFTIMRRNLEITALPSVKHFGADDPALGYTIDNAMEGDDLLLSGNVVRVAGEVVGNYDILVGTLATANADYTIHYTPALFTILRAELDMHNTELTATGITYGQPLSDSEITGVIYNDNNGEAVPGVFVWVEPETLLPADKHVMECRFVPEDEESYEAFTTTCEVTIAKAPFAIASPGASKTYGDEDPIIPYTVEEGMPQNVQVLGAPGRVAGEAVGSYELTTGTLALDNPNYRVAFATNSLFTIHARSLEITATAASKHFGADDPALGYTIDNAIEGDNLLLSGKLARETGEAVGDYDILVGTLATANANYAIHYTPALFTILRAELDMHNTELTATGITYGQPLSDSEITGSIYNDNNGEAVPGVFVWVEPETLLPAGKHVMECRFVPEDEESYEEFTTTCEVTIAKAPFAIASPGASKTYGDEDPVIPYTVENGMPQNVQVLGAPGRVAGEATGSYELTAGNLALDNPNYRVAFATNSLFTIKARRLEITALPACKYYGANDPELGYAIDNAIEGDELLLSGNVARVAGEAVGDYDILAGTLATANANYAIHYTPALFTILRATLDNDGIDLTATGIIYGQPLSDSIISGAIYNDYNDEVVPGTFVWEEPDVILPAGTHIKECRFMPEDEDSYEEFITTCPIAVAKAAYVITTNGASKVYGEADPVIPYTIQSGMPTDVHIIGELGRVQGEEVGEYELTTGTLELDNQNYRIVVSTDSAFIIARRAMRIEPHPQTKTYGEADPANFDYSISNLQDGDEPLLTGKLSREEGENVGDYLFTIGSLATRNPNYAIVLEEAFLTITKREVIIRLNSHEIGQYDPEPEFNYYLVMGEIMEGDEISGKAQLEPHEPGEIGWFGITPGTLVINDNYNLIVEYGWLHVNEDIITPYLDYIDTWVVGHSITELEARAHGVSSYSGRTITGHIEWVYPNQSPNIPRTMTTALFIPDPPYEQGTVQFTVFIPSEPGRTTVKADDKTMEAYSDLPRLTYQVIGGDTPPGFTGTLSIGQSSRLTKIPGSEVRILQGSLEPIGAYEMEFITGTLYVTSRHIVLKADDRIKYEGEPDPELTYTITEGSLVFDSHVKGEIFREPGEEPGTYRISLDNITMPSPLYSPVFEEGILTILPGTRPVEDPDEEQTRGRSHAVIQRRNSVILSNDTIDGVETAHFLEEAISMVADNGEIILYPGIYTPRNGVLPINRNIHITGLPDSWGNYPVIDGQLLIYGEEADNISVTSIDILSPNSPAVVIQENAANVAFKKCYLKADELAVRAYDTHCVRFEECTLEAGVLGILFQRPPEDTSLLDTIKDTRFNAIEDMLWLE